MRGSLLRRKLVYALVGGLFGAIPLVVVAMWDFITGFALANDQPILTTFLLVALTGIPCTASLWIAEITERQVRTRALWTMAFATIALALFLAILPIAVPVFQRLTAGLAQSVAVA